MKLDENSYINVVDCALAKILSKIPYTTEIYKIGKIKGIIEAEPNIQIYIFKNLYNYKNNTS